MKKLSILLVMLLIFLGCRDGDTLESPEQAIKEIIKLYKAEDYVTLIRTRYAELPKADNEMQIKFLTDRFTKRFSDKEKLKQAIKTYKSALKAPKEWSNGGNNVTFKLEKGFIMLSVMPNGKWGFHL